MLTFFDWLKYRSVVSAAEDHMMKSVESAIEALSDKNATIRLQFDHIKLEWPMPFTEQPGSVEVTGQLIVTITTESMKDKRKNPELASH